MRTAWTALLALWACLATSAGRPLSAGLPLPTLAARPYGLRLAIGSSPGSLQLTWSTDAAVYGQPCAQLQLGGGALPAKALSASGGRDVLQVVALRGGGQAGVRQVCGTTRPFAEPSTSAISQFIHTAPLAGLLGGGRYRYRCGSDVDGWSLWHNFTAPPIPAGTTSPSARTSPSANLPPINPPPGSTPDPEPLHPPINPPGSTAPAAEAGATAAATPPATRLLLVGDLGVQRSLTLPHLMEDAATGAYSALLHVGDLAYDLDHLEGRRAKEFLRLAEPLSAALPYMVTPGNHEWAANFTHYRSLYTMPGWEATGNLFYSYDVGLFHVASYNTEAFFWPELFGADHMRRMHDWLEADLQRAAANRRHVPWILAVGHRPMYCVAPLATTGRCHFEQEAVRRGLPSRCPHNNPHACRALRGVGSDLEVDPGARGWPIEGLLHRYGIDVAVAGHVHDYERYWPVYNNTVRNTTGGARYEVYRNPEATTHVTSGAGGNPEMHDGAEGPPRGRCSGGAGEPWCAFQSGFAPRRGQSYDWSYSRVAAHNGTHLQWQQFSATSGRVIDEWWLVQEQHGPFER